MPSTNASARRNTLAIIASVKRHMKYLDGLWTIRGTVYEPHPDGPSKNGTYRDRRNDEYPENRQYDWAQTAIQLDKAIYELTALRDYAERSAPDYATSIRTHRETINQEDN
jgi:hypothetical protein